MSENFVEKWNEDSVAILKPNGKRLEIVRIDPIEPIFQRGAYRKPVSFAEKIRRVIGQ